jgi:NADH:ubiquinone oxidoreductase subunit 6 (subunit J)
MWFVIIYFIIAYAIFTLMYFYTMDTYVPQQKCKEWQRTLAITIVSLLIGLLWIFIPIVCMVWYTNNLKK